MVKVKYDYGNVDESTGSYDGDEPTPGIYDGVVHIVEVGKSSNNNPMITVQVDITDGPFKGWRGWHYLVQTEESLWKTKEFTDALGITKPGRKAGTWDTDTAAGKKCRVKVKREMYEGEAKGKVKSILPVKGGAKDEDPADDTPDDKPAVDDAPTADEAADGGDAWSWDDLKDLDRDELKAVVKNEELDPKELGLNKDMSDEEVRGKIAEALGVEVPEDGEAAAEEDPF